MTSNPVDISILASETEDVLIGALMIDAAGSLRPGSRTRDAINQVAQILKPWDFKGCSEKDTPMYWAINPKIYQAMLTMPEAPNQVMVALQLAKMNLWEDGYAAHLSECIYMCPCSLDFMYYAKAVKEYSTQRQIQHFAKTGNIKKLHEVTNQNKPLGTGVPL